MVKTSSTEATTAAVIMAAVAAKVGAEAVVAATEAEHRQWHPGQWETGQQTDGRGKGEGGGMTGSSSRQQRAAEVSGGR